MLPRKWKICSRISGGRSVRVAMIRYILSDRWLLPQEGLQSRLQFGAGVRRGAFMLDENEYSAVSRAVCDE